MLLVTRSRAEECNFSLMRDKLVVGGLYRDPALGDPGNCEIMALQLLYRPDLNLLAKES